MHAASHDLHGSCARCAREERDGTVDLVGLRKSYGTADILHGIDLSVAQGEFMALVGPSGCGKSTLLRMIAGLETVTGGEIRFDGRVGQRRSTPSTATWRWCSRTTRSTRT